MDEGGNLTLENFVELYPYGIGQLAGLSDIGCVLDNIGKGKLTLEIVELSNKVQ